MGLRTICEHGYPVSSCRCTKEHRPLKVVGCPPGHLHKGLAINPYGRPLQLQADHALVTIPDPGEYPGPVQCPRCEEMVDHLNGSVCDFCADQLDEIDLTPWPGGAR